MNSNENEAPPKDFMALLTEILTKKYGKTIVELANEPKNYHSIADADGYAAYTGPCGDTMKMWLKISDGTIEDIGFQTDGCDFTRAAGSMLTTLVKNKNWKEALCVSPDQVDQELGGLPEDHRHCAVLAKETFSRAIENYSENQSRGERTY